jgi:tyrosine-protein phosphatase SIW14
MSRLVQGVLIAGVVAIVFVWPLLLYRSVYAHSKRLKATIPGRVYRSGQLTAVGFTDAHNQFGIHTFINVQDDFPDPDIELGYWNKRTIKESALCARLGVRYVHVPPDLVPRRELPEQRPQAIEQLLAVLDDPTSYPVLIHCKAGLHRTGVLSAVVRMEYEGWTNDEAYREMRNQGFNAWVGSSANDYVYEYVLTYRPGLRQRAEHPSPISAAAQ